jgi:hypothetical protein
MSHEVALSAFPWTKITGVFVAVQVPPPKPP